MVKQTQVLKIDLLDAVVNQRVGTVEIKEVTLAPGQPVPKHVNQCPVVGYVKYGAVLFQIEGEETMILAEGEAFYEPKGKVILHFDNASMHKPLTVIAFYLKEGKEETIKLLP
jgi:quercetin dioxygenase-like cupin family protein